MQESIDEDDVCNNSFLFEIFKKKKEKKLERMKTMSMKCDISIVKYNNQIVNENIEMS